MKKTGSIVETIIAVFLLAVILFNVWPADLLRGLSAEDITRIEVRDGNTGDSFTLTDENEIRIIVENIRNSGASRTSLAFGKMGYAYRLSFCDEDEEVYELTINSSDTARSTLFFYEPGKSEFCYPYLEQLAAQYETPQS